MTGVIMTDGWVNLIVIGAIIAIVFAFVVIFRIALARRGGRPGGKLAKPSKASQRQINPKTGDLFR